MATIAFIGKGCFKN